MAKPLGLVLAGGCGSRMASEPGKALLDLEGRTLLARAISTLEEICDQVVLVMSPLRPLPAPAYRGTRAVFDAPGTQGPLAAMVGALSVLPFDRAIVLGVDLPLVPSSSLAALAAMLEDARAALAAPHGRPQPFAAAYSRASLALLTSGLEAGDRAAVPAVLALEPRVIADAVLATWPRGLDAWLNVNTPDDLLEAGRILRTPGAGRAA